jgi:putative DNA primase/helicase
MIDLESILGSLDKVRKQGQGYIACCPVHGDNNPSMSIKQADDKILMYCHACGAKGPEIVQALGMKA